MILNIDNRNTLNDNNHNVYNPISLFVIIIMSSSSSSSSNSSSSSSSRSSSNT